MQAQSSSIHPRINWDDLRLILTIERCGSLNAAATELCVNVSTASRRLNLVEEALGILCFVRRPSGIEATAGGRLVIEHAEEIERQTVRLRRAALGQLAGKAAAVTITSPDSLSTIFVFPALADPEGGLAGPVSIVTDNRTLDLHRGEADLALRLRRPANGGLRIRKIAELSYGLFASRDYVQRYGRVKDVADLASHHLIGVRSDYPNHAPSVWWEEICAVATVPVRTDRTLDRQAAADQGLGIAMLPLALAKHGRLERMLPTVALPTLEVFLLAEPGALRVREIRNVADRIASYARCLSVAMP